MATPGRRRSRRPLLVKASSVASPGRRCLRRLLRLRPPRPRRQRHHPRPRLRLLRQPRTTSAPSTPRRLAPQPSSSSPLLAPPTLAYGSWWSLPPHARYWQHRCVPSSLTCPRVWQTRIGASSTSASTTSSASTSSSTTVSTTSPTSFICTRFWQNRCMPLSPMCALFWQNNGRTSSLTARTASPPASASSTIASTRPRHSPRVLCACGIFCVYLDNGNPDHDIDHGDPSHGYLDQGCTA